MKNIIEEIEVIDKIENLSYKRQLERAGFAKRDYQIITEDSILEYLENKAKKYCEKESTDYYTQYEFEDNEEFEFDKNLNPDNIVFNFGSDRDACSFIWNEENIQDCTLNPPEHVLKSIIKAKKDFNQIKIVTIKFDKYKLPDPLVIGKRKNSNIRYLIDWWDKDIDPTELIK